MDHFQNAAGDLLFRLQPGGFFIRFRNPSGQLKKLPPNSSTKQARIKLHMNHSHRHFLCAEDPRLPDRIVKTILKSFLVKNPSTTIPLSAEYGLYRKQLSKYVKRVYFQRKSNQVYANQFEESSFGRGDSKRLGRAISESKYVSKLTLTDIPNLSLSCTKNLQKLTNLTSLVLLLKKEWFEKSSRLLNLSRLRKLKKLALKFDSQELLNPINQDRFLANFSTFCRNLSKSNHLEMLEIELKAQHFPILTSIEILLSSLDALKISSFNLALYPWLNMSLEIGAIKNLLGQIDYLGFHYLKPSEIKDNKKYSKSLKFICPQNLIGFDMNAVIRNCPNLTTLSLEISASVMYFPLQLILPKNLKRLYIRFDKEKENEMLEEIEIWSNVLKRLTCLEEFGISTLDWGRRSYEELIKFHQLECLHNLKSYSLYITNRSSFVLRDILSDLLQILEPLKTVETWQLAFDKVVNEFEEPQFWKMLYSKENMKNLLIRIPQSIISSTVDFPFKKLKPMQQLEKLEIELFDFEKLDVLRKLPALPNIKDLKIKGRLVSIDMIEYEKLRKALLA